MARKKRREERRIKRLWKREIRVPITDLSAVASVLNSHSVKLNNLHGRVYDQEMDGRLIARTIKRGGGIDALTAALALATTQTAPAATPATPVVPVPPFPPADPHLLPTDVTQVALDASLSSAGWTISLMPASVQNDYAQRFRILPPLTGGGILSNSNVLLFSFRTPFASAAGQPPLIQAYQELDQLDANGKAFGILLTPRNGGIMIGSSCTGYVLQQFDPVQAWVPGHPYIIRVAITPQG